MSGVGPNNVPSSTASPLTPTTNFPTVMSTVASNIAQGIDPLSHVGDGIFLQTKTAKGLSFICVFFALFITCQQVILFILFPFQLHHHSLCVSNLFYILNYKMIKYRVHHLILHLF